MCRGRDINCTGCVVFIHDGNLLYLRQNLCQEVYDKGGIGGESMSWRYREPIRSDFDSDEDYYAAQDAYHFMADLYAEECLER